MKPVIPDYDWSIFGVRVNIIKRLTIFYFRPNVIK